MSLERINKKGATLIRQCGTRDPFKIAQDIGVHVMFVNDFKTLKGVYRVIKRNRWIFINANLPEQMQKIVCAHELGHDQFHRHLAMGDGLVEFVLYDMKSRPEYEANVFASQILLPDDEILDHIYNGYDAEQISRIMNTDINLVALKCAQLNQNGHKFNTPSYSSNFLNK